MRCHPSWTLMQTTTNPLCCSVEGGFVVPPFRPSVIIVLHSLFIHATRGNTLLYILFSPLND